jgi:poly(A) polymerase
MGSTFSLPEDLHQHLSSEETGVWVVGGALRDHLMGRSFDDLDFVAAGDAVDLARSVANALGWNFFVLDSERGAARILPQQESSSIRRIDFSTLRGEAIEEDLKQRDFTINALGLQINQLSKLIDPTGGAADLRDRRLCACSPSSLSNDPVRTIRAVRFATDLGFSIHPDTTGQIKAATDLLHAISIERIRDELFRILGGRNVNAAVRLLDHFQILEAIFPKIGSLKGFTNSGPAARSEWQIRLAMIREFIKLTRILHRDHDAEAAADAILGSVSLKLGRYREEVSSHLEKCLTDDRSRRSLLVFALIRIPQLQVETGQIESNSALGGPGYKPRSRGAGPFKFVGALRLSSKECKFIRDATEGYQALEAAGELDGLSDLEIHRFYREYGVGGISAALLYLSFASATAIGPPAAEVWERKLSVVRDLWNGYYDRYKVVVAPKPFVDGLDLINELGVVPGPKVGDMLVAIQEAQVVDRVRSREDALRFAVNYLKDQ